MTVKEVLTYLLEYTYERKDGAYPPLATALTGLTAGQASWKPTPERHSIWQIVRHMARWMDAGIDALAGRPHVNADLERADWGVVSGGEEEWQADVARLHGDYRRFKERLQAMSEEDLAALIEPYRGMNRYPAAIRFIKTATHDTYHIGQIRYLRALQGTR
ncbi:MAG TPA: DinB family protein [bacterium]|jgi:hypothetical protein|nr:DinB family protein [bacterium]